MNTERKQQSGFEDDPQPQQCNNPEHNPPMALYVPPGKRYRHVCPGCGFTSYLRGDSLTLVEWC